MKKRHYYVSGHTRAGFFSVLPKLSKQLDCIYVLKGLSLKEEHSFLVKLGEMVTHLGNYPIDYFHSPNDNDYLEGICIVAKKIAIISSMVLRNIDREELVQQRIVFIHFSKAQKKEKKTLYFEKIAQLEKERDYQYQLAHQSFATAKKHHNEKEAIYISAMDFKKADAVAMRLIKAFFSNREKEEKRGKTEELFFGAATPKGAVHFIDELTADVKRRYIIKGRSGSGKSTLMRRVAEEALERGYHVTYFLCGFDPSSVDMIMIDELSIAILDGTAPHVIDPDRETDKVIDMFELCIDPTIEETSMDAIMKYEKMYKQKMKEGTIRLKKAQEVQKVIDEYMDLLYDPTELQTLTVNALKTICSVVQTDKEQVNNKEDECSAK